MKKLIAKFFIALVTLSGIPSLSFANTNSSVESAISGKFSGYYNRYRLPAYSNHTHSIFLNRGYARIMISGDGDTDLDLYVYDSNGLVAKSDSYSDDEAVNLTIYSGGHFVVKVFNRGKVYNDYVLAVQ